MCGVPYHAAENYIARLIQKGYRVAICDQMEDPRARQKTGEARGHPHRHARHRDERAGAALAREQLSCRGHARRMRRAGLAHVDISTGEFRATEIDLAELPAALETLNAREALVPDGLADSSCPA